MEKTPGIQLINCSKQLNGKDALRGINLSLHTNQWISIIGPTGCGKTTLLRCIAGLEIPDSGEIYIEGKKASSSGSLILEPHQRNLGFIFQDLALWPHFTVFRNISFGLTINNVKDYKNRVNDALKQFNIEALATRYPHELSGGQQQLVALARSMVLKPRLLLMDEPLSNLDFRIKKSIRKTLQQLVSGNLGLVYVTHDPKEALEESDTVIVINEGKLEFVGTPFDLTNSRNSFIKEFIDL